MCLTVAGLRQRESRCVSAINSLQPFVSPEKIHHFSLKRPVWDSGDQVCFKCQWFLMKGIEIQFMLIRLDSSWLDESVHPVTVHSYSSVFMCVSQGRTEWVYLISSSFIEYGQPLHSKACSYI